MTFFQKVLLPSFSRMINLPLERTFWNLLILAQIPLRVMSLFLYCECIFWFSEYFLISPFLHFKCRVSVVPISRCSSAVASGSYDKLQIRKIEWNSLMWLQIMEFDNFRRQILLIRLFSSLHPHLRHSSSLHRCWCIRSDLSVSVDGGWREGEWV